MVPRYGNTLLLRILPTNVISWLSYLQLSKLSENIYFKIIQYFMRRDDELIYVNEADGMIV